MHGPGASLHPECKQTFAVHAPQAYTHKSTPFSCQWVGYAHRRQAHYEATTSTGTLNGWQRELAKKLGVSPNKVVAFVEMFQMKGNDEYHTIPSSR
jgi:hypothetical protein